MRFTYNSGQRPLDGYTLKRGIGRGGFGEVYFAVSDGGKEVALKLIRGASSGGDVELRGVVQCLNLKHPNLVALYDLRTDSQVDHWVIMEYVSGETLSAVLSRHPDGLPRELVREWFLALGKAISYLHDHGIVHRDLKPGNIFLENGTLKVGDYGLSKSISTSQRTAQTQSVGTVHYMAPEISTGNYNRQIDTYAAGVILYEMLTGRVPFEGESAGEILMKHLTAPPDLARVPAEYMPVLSKALAKNPTQRYATMAEMARAVESLGVEAPKPVPTPLPSPPRPVVPPVASLPAGMTTRGHVLELCGSLVLAALFSALATVLWAALTQTRNLTELGNIFFLSVAACWAVLLPSKFWTDRLADSWARRASMLVLGAMVGILALWLDGWTPGWLIPEQNGGNLPTMTRLPVEASYLSYYALAFFCLRWWRLTERRRTNRFSAAPLLAAGFWGAVLMLLFNPDRTWEGAVVLVMASAVVQLVSPWEPTPPPVSKRLRLRFA